MLHLCYLKYSFTFFPTFVLQDNNLSMNIFDNISTVSFMNIIPILLGFVDVSKPISNFCYVTFN